MTTRTLHIPFIYNGLPTRVIFGFGTRSQTGAETERLGVSRPLILSTPEQAEHATALGRELGMEPAGVFSRATMHTPTEITEEAVRFAFQRKADGIIAIGGGSTTGLGKAIALRTDLPQIVLPTTYAGSEMTNILGETSAGEKKTLRSSKVQPEVVIYDVDLTMSLPASLSATSGMNAIAHAVEALYAEERNPIISLMAIDAIRSLVEALPLIVADPANRDARAKALYGAWLCGYTLGSVGMALHHKLCHTLGGTFALPHAETHCVVLPHVVSFNTQAVPDLLQPLCEIFPDTTPGQGLFDLAMRLGAPTKLSAIGLQREAIDVVAATAVAKPYYNPRKANEDQLRALLLDAFEGRRPAF